MKKLVFVSLIAATVGGLFAYERRGEDRQCAEDKGLLASRPECCPCAEVPSEEASSPALRCCKCN